MNKVAHYNGFVGRCQQYGLTKQAADMLYQNMQWQLEKQAEFEKEAGPLGLLARGLKGATGLFGRAWNGVGTAGKSLYNGAKSLGNSAINGVKSLGNSAISGVKGLGTQVANFGNNVARGGERLGGRLMNLDAKIDRGINKLYTAGKNNLQRGYNTTMDAMRSGVNASRQFVGNGISGFGQRLMNVGSTVSGAGM